MVSIVTEICWLLESSNTFCQAALDLSQRLGDKKAVNTYHLAPFCQAEIACK